jgi:hypothetical protein
LYVADSRNEKDVWRLDARYRRCSHTTDLLLVAMISAGFVLAVSRVRKTKSLA